MNLYDYYKHNDILEARRKKEENDEPVEDVVALDGKKVKLKNPEKEIDKLKGQPAAKNHGVFAVDEPTDNDNLDDLDPDEISENEEQLINALTTCLGSKNKHVGFFIIGHAGWGKTSIIKDIAKKFRMTVVTVYLDKAERTDLGGIPVAVHEGGSTYQEMAMPMWARYMYDHPEQKFLLFFDEFNQAQPDVMNALMPIVQEHEIAGYKFNNFIVGAAGNYQEENEGVNPVSNKALAQRLIRIPWKDGDDESWSDTFKFMHKKWDKEFDGHGKEVLALFEDKNVYSLFESPRLIDQQILEDFDNKLEVHKDVIAGKKPKVLAVTPKRLLMKIQQVVSLNDNIDINDRTVTNTMRNLADNIFNVAFTGTSGEEVGGKSTRARSGRNAVASLNDEQMKVLRRILQSGRTDMRNNETNRYIEISAEELQDPEILETIRNFKSSDGKPLSEKEWPFAECTVEMMKQAIKTLRMDGVKPKYEKESDVPE